MSELKSVYIDRTGDWVRSGNDTGKFYLKEEVDAAITELKGNIAQLEDDKALLRKNNEDLKAQNERLRKDKEIEELKSDIADLREDKKLTDAILDERNAEIAELKHQRDGAFGLTNSGLTLEDLIQMAKKEINRQKYKRCLAWAQWCMDAVCETEQGAKFLTRWEHRWLTLANKFKETE